MQKIALALSLGATIALSGCGVLQAVNPMNLLQRGDPEQFAQHLIGPPVDIISAETMAADPNWVQVAPTSGVGAGSLVAQRQASGQCAYAQADGLFRVTRCP